jgi:outer membrane protein
VNETDVKWRLGVAVVLTMLSLATYSQENQSLRIAFVNAARIVDTAPQAAQARKRLEDEFAPRDGDLVRMQKELREAEDRLARERTLSSDTDRRRMEREILSQKRELKRAQDEFREDLNIRRNEEFAKLQRLVADVITAMAREEGFDLIVNEAAVIYASDRVDVTEMVLQRLLREQ